MFDLGCVWVLYLRNTIEWDTKLMPFVNVIYSFFFSSLVVFFVTSMWRSDIGC